MNFRYFRNIFDNTFFIFIFRITQRCFTGLFNWFFLWLRLLRDWICWAFLKAFLILLFLNLFYLFFKKDLKCNDKWHQFYSKKKQKNLPNFAHSLWCFWHVRKYDFVTGTWSTNNFSTFSTMMLYLLFTLNYFVFQYLIILLIFCFSPLSIQIYHKISFRLFIIFEISFFLLKKKIPFFSKHWILLHYKPCMCELQNLEPK